ncbi:MAG: ABC transporter ATP-binding protein [Lentisphaerales bacterium]|nr:ABC transporter ATP-binding protein [Lentisphaerales bacterium]
MLLKVKNLQTHFPTANGKVAKAVDGVSFEVNKGETVCIVGESGCGKSATAFSIMQLLPRYARHPEGEILFQGKDMLKASVNEKRDIRGSKMAMIFQEPGAALNPVFKVGPQVAETLQIHQKSSKKEARLKTIELFASVGIPHPEERYRAWPHELSGGMKQRIMIAMALACKPQLLIADEPTTALDVTIQAQILKLMLDLKEKNNMSILMITHDLGVVNQVADKVIVMYAGKVVECADRKTLFENPQHPYTKALLKAIPRSEFKGQQLNEIPGRVPPATDFPKHCRYFDRCESKFTPCNGPESPLVSVGKRHFAACHHFSGEQYA